MGTLLDFASAQRPLSRLKSGSSAACNGRADAKGEVILFPGVRYEHEALDLSARIGTIGRSAGSGLSDHD
ncbi:hypothetical protein [Roseibium sp.]|uniref:hypothetical protein n=1 Tax=Roseibium sp. TaxID=1936156 RepID=UPI003A9785C8